MRVNPTVKNSLTGLTVNIYRDSAMRRGFEGAARVVKVLAFDEKTSTAKCKVKFKQDGSTGERAIVLSNGGKASYDA